MENLDLIKQTRAGRQRYRLTEATVFVSPAGFHYIDHFDPVDRIDPEIDPHRLTAAEVAYIEGSLQANPARLQNQLAAVRRFGPVAGRRVLDIGCGGGLFLSALAAEGAQVTGVELNDARAAYAWSRHGLEVVKRPIEDAYWRKREGTYDLVTLWDVIEHVNYPLATLRAAVRMLAPGGTLLIDTPCRDAFYHRFGELTYRLTAGRYPTFLNTLYSASPFGHKQIFSSAELTAALIAAGLAGIEIERFHELSFPPSFYLRRLVASERLARWLAPCVPVALALMPIRNKMLATGQRPA